MCDDLAYKAINRLVAFGEDALHNPSASIQLSAAPLRQCYFHICAIALKSELKCQAMSCVIKTFLVCCFLPSGPPQILSIRAFILLRPRPQPETD